MKTKKIGNKNMNWIREIQHEIRAIKTDKKELVKFGLVVGGVFVGLSLLFESYFLILLIIGLALVVGGVILPKILRYPYIGWMSTAVILGFFVFRAILVVLYLVAIIPIGLLSQIFRGDFLNKGFRKNRESYWIKHQDQSSPENPY